MTEYELKKVFTPSKPARITFVDRLGFNDDVITALGLPGTQLVVYGHTGSGKTTLIENLLSRVYEKQINTNCMKGMTFEEVVLDAFDELDEFYIDEVTNSKKKTINAKAKASYLAIQTQIQSTIQDSSSIKTKRYLPPQLTPQKLAKLLGEAGYCWVLEDFHKIEGEEKEKLAQMMKVFVNLSDKYDDLKIVAIGAVNTAREVVETDNEMNTRISEFKVPLMNEAEIRKIIIKGCNALNIIIPKQLQDEIIRYSNGLGSICHKLCYFMCDAALITETLIQPVEFNYLDLKDALKKYLKSIEDSVKNAFDKAMKIPKVNNTIRIIANESQDHEGSTIEELLNWAKEHNIKISSKKLTDDFKKLETEQYGELIYFDENSSKYSFSNPFYGAYALAYFEEEDKKMRSAAKLTEKELMQLFNNAFKTFTNNIAPDDESDD